MRKFMMLILALGLVLSASFALAGSCEDACLYNSASETRKIDMKVTCSSGSGAMPSRTLAAGGEDVFDFCGHYAEDQDWYFKVTDLSGKVIAEAYVTWSGGTFSPKQVGDGITYKSLSADEILLTITK